MQKRFFNCGFTLAETLITLGIIGIIAVGTISSYKPNETARKYQFAGAYKAVSTAFYNGMMNGYNPFTESPTINLPGGFVYAVEGVGGVSRRNRILCMALTNYINHTGVVSGDVDLGTERGAVCTLAAMPSANFSGTNLPDQPTFVARGSNMAFWVSDMYEDRNDPSAPRFMMVFVDVNGTDRAPNSFVNGANRRNLADRFAFAVFDTGKITPIGLPEHDSAIMTARLGFYDGDGGELYDGDSMEFFRVKARAWGYYNGNIQNPAAVYDIMDANTLNDYVRSKLAANSPMLDGFPNLATGDVVSANNNCVANDVGACFVFVDQYRW